LEKKANAHAQEQRQAQPAKPKQIIEDETEKIRLLDEIEQSFENDDSMHIQSLYYNATDIDEIAFKVKRVNKNGSTPLYVITWYQHNRTIREPLAYTMLLYLDY